MDRLIFRVSLILLIVTGVGCRGGGSRSNENPISLSPEIANIVQGKILILSATRNGAKVKAAGFIWQSSNSNIATVDDEGVVRGMKVGVVIITATSGKISGRAKIGVISPKKGAPDLSLFGTAKYEDKPFDKNGFTGPVNPKPIRNAVVEVVAIHGFKVIGTGSTDNFGAFTILNVNNSGQGAGVYLRILSKTLEGHNTKIEVRNNSLEQFFFSVTSASVDDSVVNSESRDILAAVAVIGGAFNILDALSVASEFVQGQTCSPNPNCLPPLVTAFWEPGSKVGTFYNGQSEISILGGGGGGGDTDEYDDSVIIHEYGHFVLNKFSHDDSQGGVHGLTENDQDIRLSWSEGWANFFSSAVRGESFYVDTAPSGLLLSFDLENYSSPQATSLSANAIYTTSEVAVAGVLWDIFDGPTNDDDPLPTPLDFNPIWQTLLGITTQRATMETFWLVFEAAQPGKAAGLQTIMTGRKIELKTDSPEISGETALSLVGGSQHHTLYRPDPSLGFDLDIIPFTVEANTIYTVKTFALTNGADTFLEIKASGISINVSNDNPGNILFPGNCNQFAASNCPRNGPTNLSSSVTFNSGPHTSLDAHVSRSSFGPPSAGFFGTYDITLTKP